MGAQDPARPRSAAHRRLFRPAARAPSRTRLKPGVTMDDLLTDRHHPVGHAEVESAGETAAPMVSIVITNYNYARYLKDSVESALAQDHPALQVIVVDDGSTDDSLEVLSLLKDAYPELTLILGANGGQAAAMNRGWHAARGDWVLFLDADDMLEPGAVGAALAAADADIVLLQ